MKKSWEFSKIILAVSGITAAILSLFSIVMIWKTGDLTMLGYLIPAVFGELATATGFYYWKAKSENKIKLRMQYGEQIYNDIRE